MKDPVADIFKTAKNLQEGTGKTRGAAKRNESEARAKEKANESQWQMMQWAIDAFIQKYPIHWYEFQADLARGRSKYNEATSDNKAMKAVGWRNTAAFPVIYGKDPVTGQMKEVDALKPVLEKIIPGLTNKKSVNFSEFLKRFPAFRPSEKSNEGRF